MGVPHAELVPGLLAIGWRAVLALVVCLAVGQPGTATAVYLCVLCAMTLPRYWALPAALLRRPRVLRRRASWCRAGRTTPGCC